MKLPMKIVLGFIAVCVCIAFTQIDFSAEEEPEKVVEQKEPIIEKAFHTDGISTFVTALKTAELDDELNKEHEVTIFAPSDAAFGNLPKGVFANLMKSSSKGELKQILAYHVVEGRIDAGTLTDGQVLQTIDGRTIRISSANGETSVGSMALLQSNIEAANGVIHVIDGVMMPVEEPTNMTASRD